jgi:CheY-like chemotaxis protein
MVDDLRALVIDSDLRFRALVEEALRDRFAQIVSVAPDEAPLHTLNSLQPDLVLLAVDLPERLGFQSFSVIKRLDRHARVVLCTSTLPASELSLHAKLKIHADLYLDKREIGAAELHDRIAGLAISGRARASPSGSEAAKGRAIWITDLLEDGMDPQTALALESLGLGTESLLEELDAGKPSHESAPMPEKPEPKPFAAGRVHGILAEELAQARQELQEVRVELKQARAEARSSPYSQNYVDLQESARRALEENAQFREKLAAAEQSSARLRGVLSRLAKLLAAEQEARRGVEQREVELEARLESRQRETESATANLVAMERALLEHEERTGAALGRYEAAARERDALQLQLGRERSGAEAAHQAHERELELLRASHAEELRIALEEQETRLRNEIEDKVEATEDDWRVQFARLEAELQFRITTNEREARAAAEGLAGAERAAAEQKGRAEKSLAERDTALREIDALRSALERERSAHDATRSEYAQEFETKEASWGTQLARREDELRAVEEAHESELEAMRAEKEETAAQFQSEREELVALAETRGNELAAATTALGQAEAASAEKLAELAKLRRENSDREQSIASLQLMIDDAYRGVEPKDP